MPKPGFSPLEEVAARLEKVLAVSVADETELVWLERRRCWVKNRGHERSFFEQPRRTVIARVVERRRLGWHRTETAEPGELETGLRHALALAKVQPRLKERQVFSAAGEPVQPGAGLYDPALSQLEESSAKALLEELCHRGEGGHLSWSEARLLVLNSHGLRRQAVVTEVSLDLQAGQGLGAGHAAGSARTLGALDPARTCERAWSRVARGSPTDLPNPGVPVLLAPEATIELLHVLNAYAFSGRAYLDGSSFLSRHRGVQVFDRRFNLDDDGTRPDGLPFPFDLEGSLKKPLELIVDGRPSTPALNQHQGVETGLDPTAQAVGGQDSLFGNLFLRPGEGSDEELARTAAGGVFIGWLEPAECFAPPQLGIRTLARGVRKIEPDGSLGAPMPDLVWEDKLLRALAQLGGVGRESVARVMPSTPLGGISAPAILLEGVDGLRPANR